MISVKYKTAQLLIISQDFNETFDGLNDKRDEIKP